MFSYLNQFENVSIYETLRSSLLHSHQQAYGVLSFVTSISASSSQVIVQIELPS